MRRLQRDLEEVRRLRRGELEDIRRLQHELEEVRGLRRGELEDIRRLQRDLEDLKSSRGWKIASGINLVAIKLRSTFKGDDPDKPPK
jgi:hypothetical protein